MIFKIDSAFLVRVYGITMIGPLQYEGVGQENVKGLVLSEISAETVLCLSFGSHHELQVVLQTSREGQRQKAFGVWAGVF